MLSCDKRDFELVGQMQERVSGISSKARSREKREERKSKKFWKTVGKVLVGTAGVVAAIWGGKKIFGGD